MGKDRFSRGFSDYSKDRSQTDKHVMSVPGSRETLRDEQNHGYVDLKQLRLCKNIYFSQ
jgi:hypothetical protein